MPTTVAKLIVLLATLALGVVAAQAQSKEPAPSTVTSAPPAMAPQTAMPYTVMPYTVEQKTVEPKSAAPKTTVPQAAGQQTVAPKSDLRKTPQASASAGTKAVVVDLSTMDALMGKNVRSSTGEDLGHLIDVIIETNGQPRAAIIDFGGVLGVGSRKVAVDWHALDFSGIAKGGPVKLALTRNQVRLSPEYHAGEPIVILEDSGPEIPAASGPNPAPGPARPTANSQPANLPPTK